MGHNKWVNSEKMHILELINHESNDFKQIGSLIISRWSCHADFHNSLALFSNKIKSEILSPMTSKSEARTEKFYMKIYAISERIVLWRFILRKRIIKLRIMKFSDSWFLTSKFRNQGIGVPRMNLIHFNVTIEYGR